MLPIVMYTGYADLFRNVVSWVLLEEMMTGTMVAPGWVCSTRFYTKCVTVDRSLSTLTTYLSVPPPVPSVHIMEHAGGSCFVHVVSLRFEDEMRRELRISHERFDALDHITEVDLKSFSSHLDFMTLEAWALRRNANVNDFVQLLRSLVRKI